MARIISAAEAVELMHDGMTLGVSGFGAFASPDTILDAMGESFRSKGTPRALTIVSGVAPGDFREDGCGLSKIKDEGIIDTLIASHLRMSPAIGRACSENRIAAYTMPLGLYGQLMAAIGGHRPGIITHVGLGTYADPRQEGCRINDRAKEQGREIVRLMQIDGKDYLFYKAFRIDACILHASYADEDGNISAQSEPIRSDLLELAAAVHNNGGTVIVEVNEIVKAGSLDPKQVLIHKSYVDYIVRAKKQDNIALEYSPQLTGDIRMPDGQGVAPLPMGFKKVIARRAAMELQPGMLVNLGIGIPASVANVANEEGLSGKLTLSLETGVYGGVPLDGPLFGAAVNPDSISRSSDMFTTYDGGGLDLTVLGCAEIDPCGSVNVSKFSGRCVGPGGFVNISQNTPRVRFAFSFTSGKADIAVEDGRLVIRRDGDGIKFKKALDHITFSGEYAAQTGQDVMFITERAVFRVLDGKLTLTEIAPGVDLERDVLAKMEFRPVIAEDLHEMDARLFQPGKMGLGEG